MRKTLKKCLYLVLVTASMVNTSFAEQTVSYKNQRGSVLTLKFDESADKGGQVSGTFTSAVGPCAAGKIMPVTGAVNGNAIAISVNLQECKKVIAMSGNFTGENKELHTLWLVASQSPDPQAKDWNANIMGADHYQRVEATK